MTSDVTLKDDIRLKPNCACDADHLGRVYSEGDLWEKCDSCGVPFVAYILAKTFTRSGPYS